MPIRDTIVLVLVIASVPFCFCRPYLGILMWMILSFLNPHRFAYGAAVNFPVAETVAIPTLAGYLIFARDYRQLLSREVVLLFVLWGWFTFTSVHNTQMSEFKDFAEDTWFRWGVVSKIMLMTFVTAAIVNTWVRYRGLLLAITSCFAVLVLKSIPFILITGGGARIYGPEGTMIADNNDLGLALNMTLPMFFYLAKTETDRRIKRLAGILFVATIPVVFFTYSRGALLGLSLLLVAMILASRQRLLLIPILALAATFAIFFTPEKWQQRMDFRNSDKLFDASAESRFNAWTYCWRLASDHPITGGGFEAFTQPLFDRYAPNPSDLHGPHSIYFGVLAEHGFVGLGLYLTVLGSCFLSLKKIAKRGRFTGQPNLSMYAKMLQFSLIAFMVSGAFLGRAYFDYYFTIVACVAILKHLSESEEITETVADDDAVEANSMEQIA